MEERKKGINRTGDEKRVEKKVEKRERERAMFKKMK